MFEFYKDLFMKINGIEAKGVLKPIEKTKEDKLIFSKKTKVIIWVLGILYLIVAGAGIYTSIIGKTYNSLLKYFFLIPLDIVSLIFVLSKNKQKQFIAAGAIFLFIVFYYSTILI